MRVIGRLGFDLALGAPRLGPADRGHAGGRCGRWRRERFGRGLRLRAGVALASLGVARFALTVARFALTSRRASAAWTVPGSFLRTLLDALPGAFSSTLAGATARTISAARRARRVEIA